MRFQDRKFRRSLTRIAGIMLAAQCATGMADPTANSSGAHAATSKPDGSPTVVVWRDDLQTVPQAGETARASRIGRNTDLDSSAAASGAGKSPEDAEIALLLDWHQDANHASGAIHPEDEPYPR